MRALTILAILIASSMFVGCASQNLTEAERYTKLQKSLKYRAYQKLSKAGIDSTVKLYNKARRKEGKSETTREYIHALTGFVWTMTLNPNFALAEEELALKRGKSPRDHYIGLATKSIAFYEKGWSQLAKEASLQAKSLDQDNGFASQYDKQQQISLLVVGSLAIYEGDSVVAQDAFKALGEQTGKPWLPVLAQGAGLVTSGGFSEGYRLLRGLSNDQRLSEHERQSIAKLSDRLSKSMSNNSNGNADPVSVGRLTSEYIFNILTDKTDESFHGLVKSIRKKMDKVDL